MTIKQKSIFKTYPLFTRMVIYIMGFAFFAAIIASLAHLWFAYSFEIQRIKAKLDHLEKEQIALLTNNLWSFDTKTIDIQLQSILSDNDLVYIEIKRKDVIEYSAGNQSFKEKDLVKTYPLVHQNKTLGEATFFATSMNAKKHLLITTTGSLIALLAGIFLTCLFLVALLFILLNKPISQILNFTNTIKLDVFVHGVKE